MRNYGEFKGHRYKIVFDPATKQFGYASLPVEHAGLPPDQSLKPETLDPEDTPSPETSGAD
jgi:hypothetical protein